MSSAAAMIDAHCHLQDERLAPDLDHIIKELESIPLRKAVVNGTRPEDWPRVASLAQKYKWVLPSYGLHPWHVNLALETWKPQLQDYLKSENSAIGEIGLDRWIQGYDIEKQEAAFRWQLEIARALRKPVTIHCLKAWGRMLDILKREPLPGGFLLHSYGGPAEMVPDFLALGAYFSLSGYFAHERKERQRSAFQKIPFDRILIETDAPDMLPPADRIRFHLAEGINHPAHIVQVYTFATELLDCDFGTLSAQVENNFNRLFGRILTVHRVT